MPGPESAAIGAVLHVYVCIAGVLLGGAGVVLLVARHTGRVSLGAVWLTYRSWLVIVPLVLAIAWAGRAAVVGAVGLLALLGFKEFARATGLYRDWWMTGAGYLGIAAMTVAAWAPNPNTGQPGWFGLFMALPVYAISIILAVPILRNRSQGQLQAAALAVVGFVYIGWMFGHLGFLANTPYGIAYVLYVILAVEVNDVAAYVFGKLLGKRRLRSEVSPGKTWGGALGALAVSMCLPWILAFSLPHFGVWQRILAGVIVGVGGQLGDLAISVIKRDIGVKDMGAIIPGHGGILDRIDSLIYTAPLFLHMVGYSFKHWL